MAYSPHVKVQFSGTINDSMTAGQPVEIWSCMFSLIRAGGGLAMTSLLNAVDTRISTWFAASDTGISPSVLLTSVKVNEIGADGKQLTDPTLEVVHTTPVRGGGSTSNVLPLGTAIKVTLDDGTRNRRAKGGFYVPRPGIAVLPGGRFNAGQMATLAASTQTMLNGINTESGITVAIASKVDASLTPCERLRVGDVPDNISRRRNALTESYSVATLTP